MLNVKYWRTFCDVIYLFAQVFIVSVDRAYKEVYTKKYWKLSVAQFLWYDCTFKKQCTVPVTLTFDLWKTFFQWIDSDPISVLHEFQIDISTNGWEIKYQNMGIGLLHVKRCTRKNDVKWRPIVTKFGTLIENMSRTGLYDCHILKIFIDNFMIISNFGMGILHVKVKYWRIFCDVISLLAQVFIVLSNRVS